RVFRTRAKSTASRRRAFGEILRTCAAYAQVSLSLPQARPKLLRYPPVGRDHLDREARAVAPLCLKPQRAFWIYPRRHRRDCSDFEAPVVACRFPHAISGFRAQSGDARLAESDHKIRR